VYLNCLDLNLIWLKLRTHYCFKRTSCVEVEGSWRFGKLNIPGPILQKKSRSAIWMDQSIWIGQINHHFPWP
jgi:hypothetical protein